MTIEELLNVFNLIKIILIILSAFIVSKTIEKLFIKPLEKRIGKKNVTVPLKRATSLIIYIIAFLLILLVLGISITAAVASLGVGAIVIGFGLKDIISNWVAGVIIIAEKIYRIDDVIRIGNITGVVRDISFRSTKLKTYDRNEVIVPNSMFLTEKVINLTGGKNETVSSVSFLIDYTSELNKAKKIIEDILKKNENVIIDEKKKREIRFIIRSKEWSTEIETLFWVNDPKNEEFIKSKITESIKKRFQEEDILPPIPAFLRGDYIKSKI